MEQFSKRLSKLVSKQKLTMNQRDYTIVKSVSKQQFENKKRKQKLKYLERKKENQIYLLNRFYQNEIKKFNNNLFLIKKLILQNKKICQVFGQHPKFKTKIKQFQQLGDNLISNKNILLFFDDIDKQIVQSMISGE